MVAAIGTLAIPVVGIISSAMITGDPVGWDEILALAARRLRPVPGAGGAAIAQAPERQCFTATQLSSVSSRFFGGLIPNQRSSNPRSLRLHQR